MTNAPVATQALRGRRGLVVGIVNHQSIAWGCARASRAAGTNWP